MTNPLLEEWTGPSGTPDFKAIRADQFLPAIDAGIALSRAEIAAITDNPQALNQVYNIAVGERTTLNELFALERSLLAERFPQVLERRPRYGEFRKGDVRHSQADISKAAATRALEALIGGVKTTLKKNGSVSIVGFGTFAVSKRAARSGRNPRTGAAIKIKAAKVPKFRAGKALKDAVN